MSVWFVYILRCADGTLYTGITNDLLERVAKHNAGTGAKYTRGRRPVVLIWKRRMKSATLARKTEAAMKKLTRQQKLTLIGGKRAVFHVV